MSKVEIWRVRDFMPIEQCPDPSLDLTSGFFYQGLDYRKLTNLLNLSKRLADGGREPLTIGSMRKNLSSDRYFNL